MSKFEVDFSVDFDVDSPRRKKEKETQEETRKSDSIPPNHGPELQIIPPSDISQPEILDDDRRVIESILNDGVDLPWTKTPKAPEIGRS